MKKLIAVIGAVVLVNVLNLASVVTSAQDIEKAKTLLGQALAALTPPPPVVPIATPAAFDAALTAAKPGDVLTLARTLVYPSALTLAKAVTLQADGLTALVRMDATTPLPTFLGGITIPGDGVTLIGLEVRKPNPLTDILTFSGASVTLDRLRILGDQAKGAKRGIAANGNGNATIVRSYVDDCFQSYPGNDSQAIIAWDMGPGLLIEDNFLRAGSETILIGGADSATPERTPTNVTIRGNTITKNPAWQALAIGVKNTLEIKNARHVIVENNDISYVWGGKGQDGYLLALTVRNQDGRAPWSTVQDVVVTGNRFAHGAAAINILGLDNNRPSVRMARVSITKNDFSDIDATAFAGSNRLILIGAGPEAVTIDANTFAGRPLGSQVYFYGTPAAEGMTITNNTWPTSKYGIRGDSAGSGAPTWAKYVASGTLSGNVEK